MIDKKHFVKEMEIKIDTWHKEIQKFRIIAEVADPDPQVKQYQAIEGLTEKVAAVIDKLEAYKASEAVDREALKNEIVNLQQDVDDSIEDARVIIN